MAKKKKPDDEVKHRPADPNVMGLHPEVLEQPITETLEINYMPYAMSVIVSRAIPEIDGFKPSHRKLLYTMYTMKLLGGARTKSANIVGQTMKLNPHGDAAIYDTMVRLSRGYGALLHPLVDSKGNFGKVYSRDMAWAASRYTEARLDPICAELFRDIDQDTVDFTPNYDGSLMEPTLLPTTFPNLLVSSNMGIAVGMASNICGFNLGEVCDTTVAYLKNPGHDLMSTLKAPDFPTGGELLYDADELAAIYRTGRGSFKVRAKWRYVKDENLIEIYEIPYSTTAEAIMDKVAELVKTGKLREIADMRDETDLNGLKLTIDLKRGTDPDKLMQKLYRMTPLRDSFSCNFNILIAGMPRVMGVGEILEEWTAWRMEGVRRRTYFVLKKREEKLHLLQGLQKILLDIDRAIRIIRETEEDAEVVPNLMIGFGIDQVQAEYVADIRLRNINKEYILRRTEETSSLEDEIADLRDLVNDPGRIKQVIIGELEAVKKKYAQPRRTGIVYEHESETAEPEADVPDYPVHIFLSREGYFKKITPASLRMSSEQKYKEGDGPFLQWEGSNRDELLVFTDRQQCYKAWLSDFDDAKASVLGDYLPTKLGFDEGESPLWAVVTGDFAGHILFFFENGKAARVELSAYQTQTKRKKLTGAYSDKSPLVTALLLKEDLEMAVTSTEGRCLIFHTASLAPKSTRATQGVNVMTLKPKYQVADARPLADTPIVNAARYRARSLPVAGALLKEEDRGEEQMTLL
ncbi:topoisomerase IV [Intestinimonas massiliensis]|uniref:Topoisomerase IV n=1 Tax=Intestinimonas massiliensis (ex Afouda et al. 2020) TaxID=1673721 RepID=A0ABS9M7M8_9FIRM|nr:DNA gyrase subunit A [Intestinimonas massiliensis (ex Afouda et al. 2020)]MCG4526785.1 topoisomerase IV [Intestinimonas massiliensis (ex Afouda et al. 2020)]MCQ4807699.1 topoisomerase IV [Intestinimonas massiliensis (ex Afouda et al. 2020)]